MALPLSGQISMNDIRIELGVPSQSPFSLDAARAGTYVAINPCSTYKPPATGQVSLADWYGYDQNQSCGPTYNVFYADEYECIGLTCSYVQSNVLVALTSSVTPSYTRYYPLAAGGFSYQLTSTASGPGAILFPQSFTTCALACSI